MNKGQVMKNRISILNISHGLIFLLLILLSAEFLFAKPSSAKPIKVLVVDGFSNHDWKQTTEFIRDTLEESGLFKVDVSTVPLPPDCPEWQILGA